MTLIKSISGIRGTIGGRTGDTLNPLDIVKFTTAYATFIGGKRIVVGRDGRISGPMVRDVVCGTLVGMGYEVIDIGLATTPTTELAVRWHEADGGIIITASHNPTQWNALKLLNREGEFLTAADGAEVLRIAEAEDFNYAPVEKLGRVIKDDTMNQRHVQSVLDLRLVDTEAIRQRKFRVCADTINSVGGIILPELFKALGVDFEILNGECSGQFAHNPEPLEKNLQGIMDKMRQGGFDLGIVVDPDVDRLAFICEDGKMFGEEYRLYSISRQRQHREQPFFNTCVKGCHREAWRQIYCCCRGRSERDHEDEGSGSCHRRRRQRRCHLSREPLRSRRPRRHRTVPFLISSERHEGQRAAQDFP